MRLSLQKFTSRLLPLGRVVAAWGLRVTIGAMTVLVLTGVFMAWRMAQEPVLLRFAIPAIENALSAADGSLKVKLGGFRLRRDGLAFVFEAQNMAMYHAGSDGKLLLPPLAVLPSAQIDLSLSALVNEGVLAPEKVVANGLVVTAQRGDDGIELLLSNAGDLDTQDRQPIRLTGLQRLLQHDPRLRHLKLVELDDLTFRVVDPLLGIAWQTEGTGMRLRNEASGFTWEGHVAFTSPGSLDGKTRENGAADWSLTLPPEEVSPVGDSGNDAGKMAELVVNLERVDLMLVLDLIPGLNRMIGWQGAVSGLVYTQFAPQALPTAIDFELRVGEGRLALPLTGGALDFTGARAGGRLDLDKRRLKLAELSVNHPGGTAVVHGEAMLQGEYAVDVNATIEGMQMAWLAGLVPGVAQLRGVDLAVSTSIDAAVRLDGTVDHAKIAGRVASGTITLPGLLIEPTAIGESSVAVRIGDGGRTVELEHLQLNLPRASGERDIVLSASGQAVKGGAGQVDLAVTGLDVADLKRLWPIGLGEAGRVWVVEQVEKGEVEGLTGVVTFRLPDDAPGVVEPMDVRLDANMPIRNLALVYWPPLPIATGITAEARLTETSFAATVSSGQTGGMRITGGDLLFTGIDKGKGHEYTEFRFDVTGPASNLMAILDRQPLGFARYLNMTPAQLGGTISGTLKAGFPPVADLDLDDIAISATGETRDLVFPQAAFDQDLTDGRIRFDVDKTRLKLGGNAKMAGAPVALEGDLRFAANAPFRSKFRLRGTVGDAARRAMGFVKFPFSPEIVSGPVAVDMTATEQRQGGTLIDVAADLSKARLALPTFDWASPTGEYSGVKARVLVDSGKLRKVESFRVSAPQLSIAGNAEWGKSGTGAPAVRLSEFQLGEGTNLILQGRPVPGDGYHLSVSGPRLDARPLFRRMAKGDDKASGGADGGAAKDDGGDDTTVRFDVAIGAVQLGSGLPLQAVQGAVVLLGDAPQTARLNATTAGGGSVSAALENSGALALRASDAGALLAALGIGDRIESGGLQLDAQTRVPGGGVHGNLQVLDAVFHKAPFLLRLFSAAVPDPAKANKSWSVDEFDTEFGLNKGILTLKEGRVSGGELGATFQGWIDLNAEVLDLSGAIVPVYSVNRVLQAIPLLGDVLTGGEGLFAANYRATGSLEEPNFKVNPLTALAPGLLRRLFGNSASAPPGSKAADGSVSDADGKPAPSSQPSPNFLVPPNE